MGCAASNTADGGGGGGGRGTTHVHENNLPRDDVIVPPSEPDPNDDETIRVLGVDFQVERNTRDHHTDEYDIVESSENPQLVVRRGQPFVIRINFSRPYNRSHDDLRLVFQTGDKPSRRNGTEVEFVLSDKDRPGDWGAFLTQQNDNSIDVKVFTPPESIVDKWLFKVDVVKRKNDKVSLFRYSHKDPIYLLFNPWCKADTVFMDNQAEREEYVLRDAGRIWSGSYSRMKPKLWNFGQFSGNVLDCCMYLLARCRLSFKDRGNAVAVARQLTAIVNSPDDNGVLSGNWSGDYSGGRSPLSWTGSVAILEQFYSEKRPVKYGQCWVFSGVLTTVCRALGIPTRSVTNFASAHDVDASITIDTVRNESGEKVESECHDSVWNFHVWNEAWMARPELPRGYGGWQAIDATPQERSEGVYCCGPCPIRAIKEGEVNLPYDGSFIFAEVNADRVTWIKKADKSYVKTRVETTSVGKNISTKQVGSNGREDLTKWYKHTEKSTAERVALRNAQRHSHSRWDSRMDEETPMDVDFKLIFDADNTFVGDDFTLKVQALNTTSENRTVSGIIIVKTMYYTGVEADKVTEEKFKGVELASKRSEDVEVMVTESEYRSKLKDMCMLSFTVMATVAETGQIFTMAEDARLRKPHLKIEGPSSVQRGEEYELQLSFTNPFNSKLTKCYLELDSRDKQYDVSDVDSKETFTHTLKMKATKKGRRDIIISFNSKELEDIDGTHEIHVTKPTPQQ